MKSTQTPGHKVCVGTTRTMAAQRPLARALAQALPAAVLLSAGLLLAPAALANTYQVSNTQDSGTGSLREAIGLANNNPGPDTITFASSVTGTISLTTGSLYVYDSVDIQGPGAAVLTIDGSSIAAPPPAQGNGTQGQSSAPTSIFLVLPASQTLQSLISGQTGGPPPAIDASISGLTLSGGNSTYGGAIVTSVANLEVAHCVISGNTAVYAGGGIFAASKYGSLQVNDSIISNNTVTDSGGSSGLLMEGGGGIFSFLQDVTINRSTISGNAAPVGGGVLSEGYYGPLDKTQGTTGSPPPVANLTISNTTLSGNAAQGTGGANLGSLLNAVNGSPSYAAGIGGGVASLGSNAQIINTTVSGNSAGNLGGGLALASTPYSTILVSNSSIAGNSATNYGAGLAISAYNAAAPAVGNTVIGSNTAPASPDVSTTGGTGVNLSYSLVEAPDTANLNDNGGNIFNQAPMLGALTNNGGPTLTMLPLAGSPLIDAGDPGFTGPPNTDQRGSGYDRVVNGRVDIGSTEFGAGAPTPGGGFDYVAVPGLGLAGKFGLGALLGLFGLGMAARRRKSAAK